MRPLRPLLGPLRRWMHQRRHLFALVETYPSHSAARAAEHRRPHHRGSESPKLLTTVHGRARPCAPTRHLSGSFCHPSQFGKYPTSGRSCKACCFIPEVPRTRRESLSRPNFIKPTRCHRPPPEKAGRCTGQRRSTTRLVPERLLINSRLERIARHAGICRTHR